MKTYDMITVNNHKHFIHLWGDSSKPLLLLVHGGPGTPSISLFRKWNKPLENYFLLASYDQRGTGRSYNKTIDPTNMTVNQLLDDLLEMTTYLKETYKKDKIYILGHSFGTILSLKAIAKKPDDYYGYFAISQFVNMTDNELSCYNWVLSEAKKRNDKKALKVLNTVQPPNNGLYKDGVKSTMKVKQIVGKYKGDCRTANANIKIFANLLFSKEYGGIYFFKTLKSILYSLETIGPDMQSVDFPNEIKDLEVPVYFFSGDYDQLTPQHLLRDYYKTLNAPKKELFIFSNSAHSPLWEEQDKFIETIASIVS